jgi:Holliday junction resolvase RusA-like endonuclease
MRDEPPTIVLTLPICPSLNALWIHPPNHRGRIRSPAYNAWLTEAGWEAKRQLVGVPTIEGSFDAHIYVPAKSRRDRDGWTKALFDLCQRVGAVSNDSGLANYTVEPVERDDVCIYLWDTGAPLRVKAPRTLRKLPVSVRPRQAALSLIRRSEAIRRRYLP